MNPWTAITAASRFAAIGMAHHEPTVPGERRFPGLITLGMVEAEVERNGKTSLAGRDYLSSAAPGAKLFARAARPLAR